MEKYRPFVILGIAIFLALITTVLIISWLQTKAKAKAAAPLETQEVAVAKVDLEWGTKLTSGMIETKSFLKGSLVGGYFSDSSSLVGRVLIFPVRASEPIFESRLAPTNVKTGGVAAVIRSNKRAIALRVDKVIGVSGFIHPGNRVDVLVTLASGKITNPITKTVLENILVLAAGPEMETRGKEEKPSPVDVITLEVTPEEAEKVTLAATEGKVVLVLRNFNDTEDFFTKGITIPALLASYSSPGPVKEAKGVTRKVVGSGKPVPGKLPTPVTERVESEKPTPAKPRIFIVEVIKGSNVSQVKFEWSE
jgi:pilus assembly protein CpaB